MLHLIFALLCIETFCQRPNDWNLRTNTIQTALFYMWLAERHTKAEIGVGYSLQLLQG